MYYIWTHKTHLTTDFFTCKLEKFAERKKLNRREVITQVPDGGLIYNTDNNKLIPRDFPLASTIFTFLVSEKIKNILHDFHINMDSIPSSIVRKNGEVISGYYTLNIYSICHCADLDKSDVTIDRSIPEITRYLFNTLRLNEDLIDNNEKLFWLGERKTWLIVHQDIVDALTAAEVTGIDFIPVNEFKCY